MRQIHFRHISLREEDTTPHYLYFAVTHAHANTYDNLCTCSCTHIHSRYTVAFAGCLSLSVVTSRCNHAAKTNAFARISLRLPPTLFFPAQFLDHDLLAFLRSRFLLSPSFSFSRHIQWRMKAFRGLNIFCVISQESQGSE